MLCRNKAILNETLRSAASEGDIEFVKLMLEKGATNFNDAMCYAVTEGDIEIVKLMLENGATNIDE